MMLVTTYQHDYIPPYTRRYDFLKSRQLAKGDGRATKEVCQCVEEVEVDVPRAVEKQCPIEWTGVAPMGKLIDARLLPTKLSPQQLNVMADDAQTDCFKEHPNRFLKILRTAYPDLYERLKQMPRDELNRRLERDRMYTTYQIDYCSMNEYPEGIYKAIQDEDETKKMNASKLLQRQGPCAEFRANVMQELTRDEESGYANQDPCDKAYKPFKISFADSSRFVNSGNNSHWRNNIFARRANYSEYMDSINKIGCVIMKNNIHNHEKCTKGHCRHQLIHSCSNVERI